MNLEFKNISVAGFNIKIQSEKIENISLEDSYFGFIADDYVNYDVLITTVNNIPNELLDQSDLLFEAKDHELKYFSIYNHKNGYKFLVYDQSKENKIQQVALLNNDLCEWIIYFEKSDNDKEKYPLMYPMGPLVFYYLTVKFNAIMIHASGVFDGEVGRLFTGVSGVGKSTMANIWQNSGSFIINDDRLIIRNEESGFFIYNTPMCYVDANKKVKLDYIYVINHAPKNISKSIVGVNAVSRLLAFCIQHSFKHSVIEHHLDFISNLCTKIPVKEIGFVPNNSIVNFIKSNES